MTSLILVRVQAFSLVAWVVLHAYLSAAADIDYRASDGTFQSYNAASRMRDGEYPFRDFACYLGVGPTYVDWAASLLGPTYGDWERGQLTLRLALYCVAIVLAARLAGLSTASALALPPVIYCIDVYTYLLPAFLKSWLAHLENFSIDDHSALTVRSFAPCIFGLGMTAAASLRWNRGEYPRLPAWRGVLAGICLAWSNDYGIPSLLAILAAYVVFASRGERSFARLGLDVLLLLFTAVIVGAALVGAASGFDLSAWFDYNFKQVAPNQKWFFFANYHYFSQRATLRLADLPLFACLVPIGLFLWIRRRLPVLTQREQFGFELLMTIVLAMFGAAMLTTIGGYLTVRYFVPFAVFASILTLGLVNSELRVRRLTPAVGAPVVVSCIGLALTWGLVAVESRRCLRANSRCRVASVDLGGNLSSHFDRTVSLGLELRRRCEAERLPPERRLSSTYTSGMDIIVGAEQTSRFDYLLHAVGPTLSADYVRDFQSAEPRYVTTLRHDATGSDSNWEGWQRNVSWAFFAELLRHYDPISRTHAHVVWERRREPRPTPTGVVRWSLRERQSVVCRYAFTLDAGSEPMLIETTVKYDLHWRVAPWKLGAFAKLAVVLAPDGNGVRSCFALNPRAESSTFSLVLTPGVEETVEFLAMPAEAAAIEIDVTSAAPVAPARLVTGKPLSLICPSPCSDELFANGIAFDGRAAFRVTEADDVADVVAGDVLVFAASGPRKVLSATAGTIVVEGEPLDPVGDGFPHLVGRAK